jgi:nucleoside-diphosphate-sugar epimerase
MPAVPPNSLIAITGVTGYIASYTGLYALQAGHRVRGTVRSLARAESLKAAYEKQGIPADELNKRLEFVVVDDLSSEEQWTKALENVDGVIHAALSLSDLSDPQLVPDAISATRALLRAAKKYPSIKRVVFVSTIWTVATAPMHTDRVLSTEDWNDEALKIYEDNLPVDHDPVLKRASAFFPYTVAKIKAERAAREFVKDVRFGGHHSTTLN